MRKTILLLLITAFAVVAKADDRVLQVWLSNGRIVNINLNEEPRTTYADGNLVITTSKTTITYPLENVKRYTYALVDAGISSPKAMNVVMSEDGETLTLDRIPSGTAVYLYNVAGQLLKKIDTRQKSKVSVTVFDLPIGVYVVKANDVTYKITKR
jgi:hypothetical protein